ncbi:response regulator [Polymorphobacter fuscus]|uniref:Response regulator n=1 Tax=Sandarakinorhabdus fusca TaxID=1439888 RepID=A0A7C9GRA8_9SPHN|nr:response regulator transcription factor [Polymorphobacter fuscus]KAB7647717.1 response regulator transcription factor [Polymorphobacter fuscus]MQT17011.1 response regulator [Polymorphobacter fuscus]NJC08997.1 DNA-binding NarL/FixJ family response regulator [Polymorphobacter fuscus]
MADGPDGWIGYGFNAIDVFGMSLGTELVSSTAAAVVPLHRCLIADDHPLLRDSLAMLITARWPAAEVLTAGSFPDAWSRAAEAPDLCILDLAMPGADPLAGVAGVRAAAPDSRIVIVTGSDEDSVLLGLVAAGIAGFVPKRLPSPLLLAAIELVLAGGRYLPDRLAEIAVENEQSRRCAAPVTPRQVEVLRLMAAGLTNKAIAKALGVSPATVKTHAALAISAVGATNRTDAAIRAAAAGLI